LNYTYSINNKYNFESTVLYEYFKSNFRSYSLKRKGYVNGDLPTAGTAVVGVPFTGRTERATISIFGNIDYDFDSKYLVLLYGRRHGASIGWNVTRESFMSDVTWLNNLKLRASYGELNSTSGTSNYGAQNLFGTILADNRVGNNNLKFEKAFKSEIGIEAALFNNWLRMSSSVFQDVRKGFIYGDLTIIGTAFSTDINGGDWTSKSAELELKVFAIKNGKTSLSFYSNVAVFDRKTNELNRSGDSNN
jgi:hypothetical protein